MTEITNVNVKKLTENLVEIEAMAQELEAYIIKNDLYRTVRIATQATTGFMSTVRAVVARSNLAGQHRSGAGASSLWNVPISTPSAFGRNLNIEYLATARLAHNRR